MLERYSSFLIHIRNFISSDTIYTDELRRFAWGTDAGFYRMVPRIVLRAMDENEAI